MSDIPGIIDRSIAASVQSEVREEASIGGFFPVQWMARAGLMISPWWSTQRDIELRNFWKKIDHLAGAIYTLEAKMTAIPFTIIAKDRSIREHVIQAEALTAIINQTAQFGEGWVSFFASFLEDYLTQDNGAFAEIIGEGRKDGPILGRPLTIAHLDSSRCQRTGSPEYPVVYRDYPSGDSYKLHYTRVMTAAQMRSPASDMKGVGLCGVSRCINVSQTLLDILTFKQEKLGSRPHRAILITRGGLDPNDVRAAFQLAEGSMDSQGLSRYSKIVVAGSSSIQDAGIDKIELSSLPDGFDEQTSITLGMATIALAFGVDARELFPAMSSGATRADALLQHLKQRGKGPGQILQTTEMLFNQKFLPPHLEMVFDFQDDAQDRQVADIRKIRADRRLQDANTGTMTTRMMREQMVESGDLTQSQFERLELGDGRLPDGTTVLSLFYSNDPIMKQYLDMGADDPLDFTSNDIEAMNTLIQEKIFVVVADLGKEKNLVVRYKLQQALSALFFLKSYYQDPIGTLSKTLDLASVMQVSSPERVESRVRNENLTEPAPNEENRGTEHPETQEEYEDAEGETQ